MEVRGNIILILSCLCLFGAQPAAAEQYTYDVGGGVHYFSGLEKKSLATNSGFMGRFGGQSGDEMFRFVANFTIISSSGEAVFDDAGTDRTLTYSLKGGEFNIGFSLYPLGSFSKLPVQTYLGASGTMQIDALTFEKTATVSATFPKSDAPMLFGYSLFAGADISFTKDWGLKLQAERTTISGTVVANAFEMSGWRVMAGFFFH